MNVVLGDIQKDALDQAVVQVEQRQARVVGVVTDTMVKTSVQNLLDEATEAFGNVHLVFNNAGVAAGNSAGIPVWEAPDADWQWVMGVNFMACCTACKPLSPHARPWRRKLHSEHSVPCRGHAYGWFLWRQQTRRAGAHRGRASRTRTTRCKAAGGSAVSGFVDTQILR
ncbi:MAG: hypothetical protein CM15mP120_16950 [Pseudomonadota bacterium]|nr:MAG: hypothetical protein CM15mP120_16950 [Pseudomonadota bacterium]